jgi:hypothetical protein
MALPLRRRWLTFPSETRLRDFIVSWVRHGIDDKQERERVADEIERHWQPDPKRDRRAAAYWAARAIKQELTDMTATGTPAAKAKKTLWARWKLEFDDLRVAGKTLGEAKEILRQRYGHYSASVEAFDKWLNRNLKS